MSCPLPQYTAKIDVGSIAYDPNGKPYGSEHDAKMIAAFRSLNNFMGDYMRVFDKHLDQRGKYYALRHLSATTPDDITVSYSANTKPGEKGMSIGEIPINVSIKLHSFKTPVEPLKKELTDLLTQACREIKK